MGKMGKKLSGDGVKGGRETTTQCNNNGTTKMRHTKERPEMEVAENGNKANRRGTLIQAHLKTRQSETESRKIETADNGKKADKRGKMIQAQGKRGRHQPVSEQVEELS